MALTYKHGAYGEFAESISGAATQSGTCVVYVGTAPVNLIRGYAAADLVNVPVKLDDLAAARRYMGTSKNWTAFTLCEAFGVHFENPITNAGPVVAINVLDPALHKKTEQTTKQITFTNGRAIIESDTIILDTLVLSDKVEGVDFTIDYDWTNGRVLIDSIADVEITGQVQATYSEVDTSKITKAEIIGGVTAAGVYSGLGAVALVYQELNLIPNLIVAPGWSHDPEVYAAMVSASMKINGHWDAFVFADLTLTEVDTIEEAIEWAEDNGYTSERSKTFWPQFVLVTGNVVHGSTLAAWRQLLVDAEHNGIPMETCSNKAVPIARQYFGVSSTNRGFDQSRANDLNAAGISTAVYWGGQWVLWGGHTAAYTFGAVTDNRVVFDNSIRMMMYVTNSFQQEWALTIDGPMTTSMADTVKAREQAKADALVAVGALIGTPEVRFDQSANSTDDLVEGNFVWDFSATPTPQFKSGTIRVAYTDAGFESYLGGEE